MPQCLQVRQWKTCYPCTGNNAAIGGIKVTTANGWFAARPSGTEALFKIYGESFISEQHLAEIIKDAQALIDKALNA